MDKKKKNIRLKIVRNATKVPNKEELITALINRNSFFKEKHLIQMSHGKLMSIYSMPNKELILYQLYRDPKYAARPNGNHNALISAILSTEDAAICDYILTQCCYPEFYGLEEEDFNFIISKIVNCKNVKIAKILTDFCLNEDMQEREDYETILDLITKFKDKNKAKVFLHSAFLRENNNDVKYWNAYQTISDIESNDIYFRVINMTIEENGYLMEKKQFHDFLTELNIFDEDIANSQIDEFYESRRNNIVQLHTLKRTLKNSN